MGSERLEVEDYKLRAANKSSPLRVSIKIRYRKESGIRVREEYTAGMKQRDCRALERDLIRSYMRRVRNDPRTYDLSRGLESLQRDIMCAYGFFSVSFFFEDFILPFSRVIAARSTEEAIITSVKTSW